MCIALYVADTWPMVFDDSNAKEEFDLPKIVEDMVKRVHTETL